MNDAQAQRIGRLRRQLAEQAITQAMDNQWAEAIETNRRLIDAAGQDSAAYNRLGTAYARLGRIAEARTAYSATLALDPTNAIAQRHVMRLAALGDMAIGTDG